MSFLAAMLDLLPAPYTQRPGSTLAGLLGAFALELEAYAEDTDRMRRTHWVETAYRLDDLAKIGALAGVPAFGWEDLEAYRARLVATVIARLAGSVGPVEIKTFVVDYVQRAQQAFGNATFVPGIAAFADPLDAFAPPQRGHYRPPELAENPIARRRSAALDALGNRVTYLHRWSDTNGGLDPSVATFRVGGFTGSRTAAPILMNLTTGDALLYRGVVKTGALLEIFDGGAAGQRRKAQAMLDGKDVTAKLTSSSALRLGGAFDAAVFDPAPLLPRMARGKNDWIYLSAGYYGVRGLDEVYFWLADDQLRQGFFGTAAFDHAIFATDAAGRLEMWWDETQPATFEVRVPRTYVVVPRGFDATYEEVAEALTFSVGALRAAGVRASVRFVPFTETQPQRVLAQPPFVRLDPETGSAGMSDRVRLGAAFGRSTLGTAVLE